MNNLFNSSFEVSMRLLLLLSNVEESLNEDEIAHLDFITIYSKDYGYGNENINGECVYPLSEFSLQRQLIKKAIKELVTSNYIYVIETKSNGFTYRINEVGRQITSEMTSDYSQEYSKIQKQIINDLGSISISKLKEIANRKGW